MELRPGGPFEIYMLMDNPPGLRGSEGCKVLSYLPLRMLSFTWNAPPEYPDIRDNEHKTWVVVQLTKKDESTTMVEIDHLGWKDGKEWDAVFDYFHKAWEIVLQWLETSIDDSNI